MIQKLFESPANQELNTNLKQQMLQLIPGDIQKDTKKIADWFHQQGFEARRKEDFVKAVEFYTMALMFNQRHFKAIFNRGFNGWFNGRLRIR
jgi:hypothetical protein